MSKSKDFVFDGGGANYILTAIFGFFVTVLTLGIGYPWAVCSFQRWKAKHTYIQGRQLVFTGGGFSLLGLWIIWMLLLIITLGIYTPWFICRAHRWIIQRIVVKDHAGREVNLKFEGKGEELLGTYIAGFLLTIVTFGIYMFWFQVNMMKFIYANTEITTVSGNKLRMDFTGTGLENFIHWHDLHGLYFGIVWIQVRSTPHQIPN